MKTTAAALVRHALEQIGVRYTFGIPGVHNIELYDELLGSGSITPVLVTHEGGGDGDQNQAKEQYLKPSPLNLLKKLLRVGLIHIAVQSLSNK